MYNMTVAIAHTYIVGDGEWVVHNACGISRQFRLVPIHTVEAPTWVPIGRNDVGSIFMGTTRVIDVDDVESALEIYGAGTVLSGRHGGIYPLHKELKFLVEDLNLRYSSVSDISVLNFNLISRQQLMNIGGNGQIVYASWCNSNECEILLEILSP